MNETLALALAVDAPVYVTEHARWRAAERFPFFDTVEIEDEVRDALLEGRVTRHRVELGLHFRSDETCFYVFTPDRRRIYALRSDEEPYQLVVTTTLSPRA